MFEKRLSFAYVKRKNSKLQDVLNVPLSDFENLEDSQYLLVIQSNTKEFSKITIYPLKREKIIKVVLKGINIIEENIDIMINELQNFELIHTSGLIQKDKEKLKSIVKFPLLGEWGFIMELKKDEKFFINQ